MVGNSLKAGVRFVSYDHFKSMLADSQVCGDLLCHLVSAVLIVGYVHFGQGKVSAPRSLVAGLGAGMMEAIFAVTPSETIKYANSWIFPRIIADTASLSAFLEQS